MRRDRPNSFHSNNDRRISIMNNPTINFSTTKNIILNVDSYKTSHYLQYPPNTTQVSSYIEARGGNFQQAIFFGLQMFIKDYLGQAITNDDIDEAKLIIEAHGLPFNEAGWRYIVEKYDGYLPIEIQAIP